MDRLPGGKVAYPRSRNLVCVSLVAAVVFMIGFRNQFVEAFFGGYGRPLSQDMQIEILAKLDIMEAKMQRMAAGRSRSMSMKRPPNLCDYSDDQIESILQLPHGSRKGELRYYHRSGAWVNLTGLDLLVKDLGPEQLPAVPGVVCTVVSIMGQVPCQTEACLLQVNWRPNSTDWWVIDQLLEKGEYEIVSGLQGSPATVLDAGANFGLGTLFFATMWPQARIVTIEPADSNFKMVELNTRDHPNVIRVKAGLWWRVAKLAMVDGTRTGWGREWGFMVKEADEVPENLRLETLTAVSIPFLMETLNIRSFDYMKVDIEGSEREVFTAQPEQGYQLDFLDHVQLATVEVHSDMREGAKEAVVAAFSGKKDFVAGESGEYLIWSRNSANRKEDGTRRVLRPATMA